MAAAVHAAVTVTSAVFNLHATVLAWGVVGDAVRIRQAGPGSRPASRG